MVEPEGRQPRIPTDPFNLSINSNMLVLYFLVRVPNQTSLRETKLLLAQSDKSVERQALGDMKGATGRDSVKNKKQRPLWGQTSI